MLGNYFAGEDERLWIVFISKVAQEVWCTYQAHHGKYSAYRSVELGRVDPHALRQICLKKEHDDILFLSFSVLTVAEKQK